MVRNTADIISRLQKDILSLGGIKSPVDHSSQANGLELLRPHFPYGTFPLGAVHEFITGSPEVLSVSCGFISGLISAFLPGEGIIIWINRSRNVFPPSLLPFNIAPHKIIFIHPSNEKEIWWCTEEALGCNGITAVVTEMQDLNFTNSRRFQLAVEKSKVTGFMLNSRPVTAQNNACVSRWKINSLPSVLEDGMPGVGHPRWKVNLQKIRNGKPGSWDIEWVNGAFRTVEKQVMLLPKVHRKTG